jgi:hypothetical protein
MKKIAIFLSLTVFFSAIAPLISNIHFEKKYTYSNENVIQKLSFSDTYAQESSLSFLAPKKTGKIASGNIVFSGLKNMITLKIKRNFENTQNPEVSFTVGNKKILARIDDDGDERSALDEYLYTSPIFIDDSAQVKYTISFDQ